MQVATADADGRPDVRTVLARGFDAAGVVFYTNYDSAKGRQLAANPVAAALFSWLPLERQVRLRGPVQPRSSRAETAAYFAGRPRGAQLAAWASPQSQLIAGPGRAGARAGRGRAERFGDGRDPAAAALGRLPDRGRRGGVLAGPGVPAARPAAVPAGRDWATAGTGLGARAARPRDALAPHAEPTAVGADRRAGRRPWQAPPRPRATGVGCATTRSTPGRCGSGRSGGRCSARAPRSSARC